MELEETNALNYLLAQGMSLEEVQSYLRQNLSLDEVAQAVKSRVDRGEHPTEDNPGGGEPRPDFTLNDFKSGRVFEWLTGQNGYRQALEEPELAQLAKEVGFKAFAKCLREYKKLLRSRAASIIQDSGLSDFAEQRLELDVGEWTADESGIWRYGNNQQIVYACTHPIMPVQRMVSIDTGLVKIKLAYRRSYTERKPWSEIVVPMSRIAKAADIVALADCGISVTSGERAQALVDYLRDAIDRNQDRIPEVRAVSRMGWNEEGFSPYVGNVVFDSAGEFRSTYSALRQAGTLEGWLEEALDARAYSLGGRVALAASFAAPLVEITGCLPFFVHLWATGSGAGKSVALMLSASVWGEPTIGGGYVKTFKGTSVGFEQLAGFLHSLPVLIDELQLSKNKFNGKTVFNVYELAAGAGKLRSNKQLGLDYTPKWDNCFITTGESPLTEEADGAGAFNRVIDICCTGKKIFREGRRTANNLKRSYGHAGKLFIQQLCQDGMQDKVRALYEQIYTECNQSNATEKQAMAAALILTADRLATDWIFGDNRALTLEDLTEFLHSEEEVSLADRGYEYVCGWVAANANQFAEIVDRGERYGIIDGDIAVINRVIWNRICEGAGISSKSLLSGLKEKGLLVLGPRGYTRTRRLDGVPTACVWLRLPADDTDCVSELPL